MQKTHDRQAIDWNDKAVEFYKVVPQRAFETLIGASYLQLHSMRTVSGPLTQSRCFAEERTETGGCAHFIISDTLCMQ